jgi:Domain of unknown function (DUF4335)
MNSSNLQPRQFVHNTCELSIDDKKSPFPAWMKFNKPNPLRFSLNVQDPDRPELEPMTVSGDRNKLEALHNTVEEYVKELLQRAPLPELLSSGENAEKLPRKSTEGELSGSLGNNIDSLVQNRPIDALKVNDDRPRIEADGLSRHLFYLGSGAEANTTVMSLSTLQLFDLSSALTEGLTPVVEAPEPEKSSITDSATAAAPVVITPPESVTNNNNSVVNSLKSDVEEPRVILPSVNEPNSGDSEDLYGLETESSILERSTPSRERFNKPKPSLGSLNLPELPDFSRSPLTSIPLWLGLGGMAALIVAFPFLSSYFKTGGSVAKKPAVTTTQVAAATGDTPSEYQPTTPSIPSGVGTPTVGGLPSPSSTLGGLTTQYGAGTTTTVPVSPYNTGTGVNTGTSINSPSGVTGATNTTNDSLAARQRAALQRQQATKNGTTTTQVTKPTQTADTSRPNRGINTDGATQQARVNQNYQAPAMDDDPRLKPNNGSSDSSASTSARSRSRVNKPASSAVTKNPTVSSDVDNAVVGQASEFTGSGSGIFKPVEPPAKESTSNLDVPSTSPVESVQTRGLQGYFQNRWKADPNFDESLQYRVNVAKNGRVLSIEGQTEKSRVYLNKTGFLKPGEVVSKSAQQDQKVWLILNPTGDVQTLADSE